MGELEKLCLDAELKKRSMQAEDRKSALDPKTKLNFVESKNKKQSSTMKTAFSVASDSGMNPVWVTFEQALKMAKEPVKSHVFVIDTFRTELYDHLQANANCLIYGPSCIFYCRNQLSLPCRRFPIFNLCMHSLEICVDDERFDEDEVLQLFGLTNLMCGTFSYTFRPTTTHVISNDLNTEKSRLARTYGVPILTTGWIKECWERSLSTELNADDKAIVDRFRLPVFHGFQINVSQIDNSAKTKILKLITKHGGEQVPCDLRRITHLILGEATGDKYEAAKAKSTIKIVREAWIHESVRCGYALLEYDYLFEPSGSQPKKFDFSSYSDLLLSSGDEHFRSSSQISQSSCSFSVQLNSRTSQIITPYSNATAAAYTAASQTGGSRIAGTQIAGSHAEAAQQSQKENSRRSSQNDTCTQIERPKPPQPCAKQTYCVKSKTAELAKSADNAPRRTAFSVLTSSSQRQSRPPMNVDEELEKLANQLAGCRSSTFDGCDFFINDSSLQQTTKNLLKRCITLQNGTISTSLRQSVSHVIVREDLAELERKKLNDELDRFDHTINQVSLKWIIQCSKSSKLQPTIDLSSLSQPNPQLNGSFVGPPPLELSQQPLRQSQRMSRLRKSTQLHEPVVHSLPIREVRPLVRSDDDIFNDYSDVPPTAAPNSSSVFVQPQTVPPVQPPATQRCPSDLDLMRREEKPLYKCVLTISSYSVALKEELTRLAHRLGATCQLEFVKNDKPAEGKHKNTHLVCEEATGKKYERALKWGVHCVNQGWLRKCEELVQRVDERDHHPMKAAANKEPAPGDSTVSSRTQSANQSQNSETKTLHPTEQTDQSLAAALAQLNTTAQTSSTTRSTTANTLTNVERAAANAEKNATNTFTSPTLSQGDVLSKFNELRTILNGKNGDKGGASASRTLAADDSQMVALEAELSSLEDEAEKADVSAGVEERPIDILSDDRFKNQPKQNVPIGWNEQRLESRPNEDQTLSLPADLSSTSARAQRVRSTSARTEVYSDETMVRNRLVERPEVSAFTIHEDSPSNVDINAQVAFNFIGYTPEEKQEFARLLARLNIRVIQDNSLDFEFLVTTESKLIKNELFFVSIAKGKWICHPDFFRRTLELGAPPDPEQYEWGSNKEYLKRLDGKFLQLARACRYWRIKVAETRQLAFYGQSHVVISKNAKNYASIIQNGGGRAISVEMDNPSREKYVQVLNDVLDKLKSHQWRAQYLLINFKKKERDSMDLCNLVKPIEALQVKCLAIDYLSLFLVSHTQLLMNNILINPIVPSNSLKRANSNDGSPTNQKAVKR